LTSTTGPVATTAAAPATACLRREHFKQFGDVAGAERPDLAPVEHKFRIDVAEHGAGQALTGDDDLLTAFLSLERLFDRLGRLLGLRLGGCFGLLLREGRLGHACDQKKE
jgi:hypothetical protein